MPQRMGYDPATDVTWLDSSATADLLKCPRRYYLKHVLRRVRAGRQSALDFGKAWHKVMEIDSTPGAPPPDLHAIAIAHGVDATEDHRTEALLADLYSAYKRKFPVNHPTYVHAGQPVIEGPFAFPLAPGVMWCGRIDRLIQLSDGRPAVLDHKTSFQDSAQFWGEFTVSIQQTGYCWAASQACGEFVDRFVIHAAFTRKTKPDCDERIFIIDHRAMDDWRDLIVYAAACARQLHEAVHHAPLNRGQYANRAACYADKYGACPFVEVCAQPDLSSRQQVLGGAGYTENLWSPLDA